MIPDPPKSSHHPPGGSTLRRMHVGSLSEASAGASLKLEQREAHHLVRVLRMTAGGRIELFDESGRAAPAELHMEGKDVFVRLLADPRLPARDGQQKITVYSALPKGSRADWMVEKLCELGVWELVPLLAERSVVEPGAGKLARFARIAREAAAQSRRSGALLIAPPARLEDALARFASAGEPGAVLTTERPGRPLAQLAVRSVFIGPEGGWSVQELEAMTAAQLQPARLTGTILRTETAAVCAAGVLRVCQAAGYDEPP